MTWSLLAAAAALLALAAVAGWLALRPGGARAAAVGSADSFRTAVRGYRMDQVDEVVERLRTRIASHDVEIARLRGEEPAASAVALAEPQAPAPPTEGPVDAGDDPPPRDRPAAGTDPTAGDPAPWRAGDWLAPLAYLVAAAYVTRHLLAGIRTGYLSQGVQDQQAFEWYFGATAHNLVTFSNPLISDLQNFPDGVNLMANAAVLGLGVPLAPVTLLAGPEVTFVLVELLGLALTASAWYVLFRRRLAVHPALAFLGAALAGFGPGMVSHANGHPNFVVQALVPLVVDRVLHLAEGRRPVRDGVVLGLLVAWQVLIGEEVLLLAAVGIGVAGAVLLSDARARARLALRPALQGLGLAAGLAAVLVAFPLWWQFSGPQSYTSIWHPPAGNDLAQLWGRATRTVGADPWASAAVSMNRTEENSFFGVPLWVAAAVTVLLLWRSAVVRALAAVVVVSCWLSLGEELTLHGTPLGVPGPWALLEHVPVVENVLPTRFALVALPAFGALLALGAEALRRRVDDAVGDEGPGAALAVVAAALVLAPVVPTPLVVDPRDPVPAFFTAGAWRGYVDDGGSVLAAPPPDVADTRALEWQAAARWQFPVVAGYFVGPDGSPERGGQYGATPTGLTVWLAETARSGVPTPATPEQVDGFTADLRAGRVDAIVLPDGRPSADALRTALSLAFGEPDRVGGVSVWDVRGQAG
ncbi:glycosyl transferase [Phycicoccus sp. CSK15P-2]|uniref:glycosyl transferase n=1 Tax=Phycicoccus sp. CSK15P-2 TaxID=2807627 RepID=UPI00194F4941|nr:glycosyl transferase [Phycicoccus sp. CSK15P-2]MBM6405129.1 glycosyl transferase [Phycicoccus sp. CSK15P-2]